MENSEAETPVGSAVVMLNVTEVVRPDRSVAVTVSTPPAPPAEIVRVAGEGGVAVRLKSKRIPTAKVLELPVWETSPAYVPVTV